MIDEVRLARFDTYGCPVLKERPKIHTSHFLSVKTCDCEMKELARLARIGMWAENMGIAALEQNTLTFNSHEGLYLTSYELLKELKSMRKEILIEMVMENIEASTAALIALPLQKEKTLKPAT